MSLEPTGPDVPAILHSKYNFEELTGKRKPRTKIQKITSVADVLEWERELRLLPPFEANPNHRLPEVWFRGTSGDYPLEPGIYREAITRQAAKQGADWSYRELPDRHRVHKVTPLEWRRLELEREMMSTFEREGRYLFQYEFEQELYFAARHYGMPSRLLDWSVSPLVALFICVFTDSIRPPRPSGEPETLEEQEPKEEEEEYGVMHAMDPEGLEPPGYMCHQHDPLVEKAVKMITMWGDTWYGEEKDEKNKKKNEVGPFILPVRPHTLAGRIDRQMARFTLHSYGAAATKNERLWSRRVPNECKEDIRRQLERIGINEFSVYVTLDRLTTDIKDRFSS